MGKLRVRAMCRIRVRVTVKARVRYAWFIMAMHGLYRHLSMDCTVLYRAMSKSALCAQHIF